MLQNSNDKCHGDLKKLTSPRKMVENVSIVFILNNIYLWLMCTLIIFL